VAEKVTLTVDLHENLSVSVVLRANEGNVEATCLFIKENRIEMGDEVLFRDLLKDMLAFLWPVEHKLCSINFFPNSLILLFKASSLLLKCLLQDSLQIGELVIIEVLDVVPQLCQKLVYLLALVLTRILVRSCHKPHAQCAIL